MLQQQTILSGFAQFLVTQGYLNEKMALSAQKDALEQTDSFIGYLGKNTLLKHADIAEATAKYFNLPLFDLNRYNLEHLPPYLSSDLIQKNFMLPLHRYQHQLLIAVADPTAVNLSEISFLTGLSPLLIITEANKLTQIIDELFATQLATDLNIPPENLETDQTEKLLNAKIESDSAPIVNYINKIIFDAINTKSSDIHFEPYEHSLRIRYRIDGILYEIDHKPHKLANYILSRLKIMANLDIAERRVPQDGRFKMTVSKNGIVDFRLSTCPTLFGEKAVLRILESSSNFLDLTRLGMNPIQLEAFKNATQHSQGMILVTGPTGSGKTITLYSALHILNTSEVNILSVEDPIEIQLPGINQVPINPKAGFTFASALKAFLRQDPDIMMVGEIRDLETGELAVKAAQTGHLVLSTLHTNNASDTLIRLANMGIPLFNIASSIILIMAQRLVRCLCNHCKQPIKIPAATLIAEGFCPDELKNLLIFRPVGCIFCHHGYQSRIGIFEVMPISKAMVNLILNKASSLELAELAKKEGILNLRLSGLEKVKTGITSLEELNRVVKH